MRLVILGIISIIIILVGILLLYCNFEVGDDNVEHFSQKDIIQPTTNKTTIFKAIQKIQEDIDEVNFLLEQKKKNNEKYDEMFVWYEKQRKTELGGQRENDKDAVKLDKKLKEDANREMQQNKAAAKGIAKAEADKVMKKDKGRMNRQRNKMNRLMS